MNIPADAEVSVLVTNGFNSFAPIGREVFNPSLCRYVISVTSQPCWRLTPLTLSMLSARASSLSAITVMITVDTNIFIPAELIASLSSSASSMLYCTSLGIRGTSLYFAAFL